MSHQCRICETNLGSQYCTQKVCARCCRDKNCVRHYENKNKPMHRKEGKRTCRKKNNRKYWIKNKYVTAYNYCKLCIVIKRQDGCNKKLCNLCCTDPKCLSHMNRELNNGNNIKLYTKYENHDKIEELTLILGDACEILPSSIISIVAGCLDNRDFCIVCLRCPIDMKICYECEKNVCDNCVKFKEIICGDYDCFRCIKNICQQNTMEPYCKECDDNFNKCSVCNCYSDSVLINKNIYRCYSCNASYCTSCSYFEHLYSRCNRTDCKTDQCAHIRIIKSLCVQCKYNQESETSITSYNSNSEYNTDENSNNTDNNSDDN